MPLNVLIIPPATDRRPERTRGRVEPAMREVLRPDDHWEIGDIARIAPFNAASEGQAPGDDAGNQSQAPSWDLIIAWEPCGWSATAAPAARSQVPCMALLPPLVFHPYAAAFNREVEERGGVLLPAGDPGQIAASINAVRAGQIIKSTRLLVVDDNEDNARAARIGEFAVACGTRWGLEIIRRPVSELLALAAEQTDEAVETEWDRWLADLLIDAGEMSREHMMQVVRLYLAERRMLAENDANGITVDDIGAFLTIPEKRIMPNCTYAPLTRNGYLCCEEGDIEALATEAILQAGLSMHPTMSNIYMAYRDALEEVQEGQNYTPEMERRDYLQCIDDNHLVAAHFSTSGVLPADMMVEERYRIREALPSWPGQSMTASTPRLGPVVLGRLNADASRIHLLSGVVDESRMNDRYGWYRGRWMIRVPSATSFTKHCIHQHYAIGRENSRSDVLDTLTRRILRLKITDDINFRPGDPTPDVNLRPSLNPDYSRNA